VLVEVKSDASFKSIPVIILTTSKAESDITKAYEEHANGYITKPVDFDGFVEVVRSIDSFWFYVITLPTP
jgi:two-component system response regulator